MEKRYKAALEFIWEMRTDRPDKFSFSKNDDNTFRMVVGDDKGVIIFADGNTELECTENVMRKMGRI